MLCVALWLLGRAQKQLAVGVLGVYARSEKKLSKALSNTSLEEIYMFVDQGVVHQRQSEHLLPNEVVVGKDLFEEGLIHITEFKQRLIL